LIICSVAHSPLPALASGARWGQTAIMANRAPEMSPGRDNSGMNLGRKAAVGGAAFTADLSAVGSVGQSGSEAIFGAERTSVLDEERSLIDKVFSIVDKDNSGTIDSKELEEMFKLFGVETHYLTASIDRVLANVDKDQDGMISPAEFYNLLSQKFNKGDSEREMEDVFDRMGARPAAAAVRVEDPQKEIGINELHKVALTLGETNMAKVEVKDMIRCFKRLAAHALVPAGEVATGPDGKPLKTKPAKLRSGEHYADTDEKDPANILNLTEFIAIMNMEL